MKQTNVQPEVDEIIENGFEKLDRLIADKGTQLMLGLDPTKEMEAEIAAAGGLLPYLKKQIDSHAPHIVGVKPNLAFYEATPENREAMMEACNYAKYEHGLVVVLDVKHGDIFDTQSAWAAADMLNFEPDIVTLTPYMGVKDVVMPYLESDNELCVYIVCASSNPDGENIQNLNAGGITVYQNIVMQVHEAGLSDRVGLVVGSTKSYAMEIIRAIELEYYPDQPLCHILGPGYGKQGGDLEFLHYSGKRSVFPISSGLTKKKYLDGRAPEVVGRGWRRAFNSVVNDDWTQPFSVLMLSEVVESGLIWIAPSADESSWRDLAKGGKSPIFASISDVNMFPELKRMMCFHLAQLIKSKRIEFDYIAGAPYGGIGIANLLGDYLGKPVITPRKEGPKATGNKSVIVESSWKKRMKVLVIEDVTTSGGSAKDAIDLLLSEGLFVTDVVSFLDREAGGYDNLKRLEVSLHSPFTLLDVIEKLSTSGVEVIPEGMDTVVMDYIKENRKVSQLI